jgi:hypothetical protein
MPPIPTKREIKSYIRESKQYSKKIAEKIETIIQPTITSTTHTHTIINENEKQ